MIIKDMFYSLINSFGKDFDTIGGILALLFVIFLMSLYEFVIYRLVSHKALYNKSFHITVMVIPFFIGGIIAALQSDLIVTLGTIGALAIVRFRTAVKDPVDMIYILWSVFIGITCGCKLYETCVLTSVVVTLVLVFINVVSTRIFHNPYVLVINASGNIEAELKPLIESCAKRYRIKSRNFTSGGVDYVYQIEVKEPQELTKKLEGCDGISRFSLLEFDNEDVM